MLGLVSLIPEPFHQRIEKIWDELETNFNLVGFLVSPIPHFSWQIAEDYDLNQLVDCISKTVQNISPIRVRTNGIGLFTGLRQVIYIPIIKDCELINIHTQIWTATQTLSNELNPLYSPDLWVPHITLIHENLTPENIGPVMKYLVSSTYNWEMTIDKIALVSDSVEDMDELQIKASFQFQGK